MSARAEAATRWASFHLFLPGPLDPYLTDHLLPFLERETAAGSIERFFFIRYGVGTPHLRLRLLPGPGTGVESLLSAVEGTVRAHVTPTGAYSVEMHPYSRSELYFGETAASVYAELLNEATSRLCLEILAAPGGDHRVRRWLSLAAVLDRLVEASAGDEAELRSRLAESRAFARWAASEAGFPLHEEPRPPHPALDAALRSALVRLRPSLGAHPTLRRIARLLRRVRRNVPGGPRVAVHALHLLCNKLGFSLHEEHDLFTALHRMRAPCADARENPSDQGRTSPTI